jgi:predicted MFS family arabinose efflux permease
MTPRQTSSTGLLILLCLVVNFASVSVLMLGPLLVALAHAFQTSVAMVGQLGGATALAWGITAPLAGPVSDAYGQRPMLLTGLLLLALGLLGAVLAWNYEALLTLRLLTGVGAALIPPNSVAIVSEVFPPTARGKAIGWLISAGGLSAVAGVPLVVALLAVGGWPLPFLVLGTAALSVGLLCWVWLPQRPRQPGHALAFFAHYREVGTQGMFWWVLVANALEQMAFFGLLSYLAAHLMQSYHLPAGDTALPLALVGGGVIVGGFLGGRVADHRCRLRFCALSCVGSGLPAAVVFMAAVSSWTIVALACGAACLARISSVVVPTVLLELAGGSRTTATGLFALSNQLGVFGGTSLGGLMLALGGFPLVGLFCLVVAVLAAVVIRLTVRDSVAFLTQLALREGRTAPE